MAKGNAEALENARRIQREKNETKKAINGRLQDVVDHSNGLYVMIGETKHYYIYHNLALGTIETIDKKWKSFPSNEGFGTKSFDHCWTTFEQAEVRFPLIKNDLYPDWKERVKNVNS